MRRYIIHSSRDSIALSSRYVVILLCFSTLLGWFTDILIFASILPSKIPMAPSTAFLFLLLICPSLISTARYTIVLRFISSAVVVLLSLTSLIKAVVRFEWESLFVNQPELFDSVQLGRMSPLTAWAFLFAAAAILISISRLRYRANICMASSALVVVIGAVVVIGYVYNTPLLYGGDVVPMAFSTGLAFVALGISIVTADGKESHFFSVVGGNGFRSRLIKLFLPVMVGLALVQGWIAQVLMPLVGIDNPALAASLSAIGSGAIVAGICVLLSHRIASIFDRSLDERDEVERALRKSQEFLNETQKIAKVGGWEFDVETLEGTWTEETARIHDIDPTNPTNVKFGLSFYRDEHRKAIERAIKKAIELGKPYDLELELITARNVSRWVRTVGFPQYQDGRVVRVRGMIQDITDKRLAEKALLESEQRLRLALWAARQGLYDLNVRTGKAIINDEYALMLGYDPETFEETNEKWIERLHPDDQEKVANTYRAYIRGELPEYRVEFRQKTQSGDWKWILSIGSVVEWDEGGKPLRMLGTHTDITDRKRVEEALQNERDTAQLYLDVAEVMITALNRDGQIVLINKKGCEILGYEEKELIGRNWFDLCIPPPIQNEIKTVFNRLMKKEIELLSYYENIIVNKAGEERLIAFHNIVIQDKESNVTGILSSGIDITERKRDEDVRMQLEAQLYQAQKMEAVGRLAGGVAHDFNNMLNVIIGYTELTLDRLNRDDPLSKDLQEVLKAANRSMELTKQLLAFARKQVVEPKIINVNVAIANLENMLRRLIGEDIEMHIKQGSELGNIRIDPSQFDQIITNLAVNARDAIQGGGVITIETFNVDLDDSYCQQHPTLMPGEYVMVAFSDNGCGMDRETIDRIFEPFFTTKEKRKGTGLGLAMIYGIVEQNGGFINVYSEPGHGTTFKIYFPKIREDAAGNIIKSERDLTGFETILVVEDEVQVRNLTKVMLKKYGYTVLDANSPEEAIALCAKYEGDIHLLLTDVVMPGFNGKELYEKIVTLKPGIKVVFMSGYTEDIIAHRGILPDGTQFIHKPFSLNVLAEKMRAVLD